MPQLDLPANQVRAVYQTNICTDYQIYDEAEYDPHSLLRLHIMEEHVFELAKYNKLRYMQWKVEYLRNARGSKDKVH